MDKSAVDLIIQKNVFLSQRALEGRQLVPLNTESIDEMQHHFFFDDNVDTLMISAGLGLGKSTVLDKWFLATSQRIDKMVWDSKRMIAISDRRSLITALHSKLKKHGFVSYLEMADRRDVSSTQKIMLSINSLYRLTMETGNKGRWLSGMEELSIPNVHLLSLDEFRSALSYIGTATTFESELDREKTLQLMIKLISGAKRCVVLDANLDDFAMDFLARVRPDISKQKLIRNTFQKNTMTMVLHTKPLVKNDKSGSIRISNQFYSHLINSIVGEGKRVAIYCDMKVTAEFLRDWIDYKSSGKKRIKLYTSFDDNEQDKKDAMEQDMKDVDTAWSNLDVMITTSTIVNGVSFTKHWFDIGYLIGSGTTVVARDMVQMTGRIRHYSTGIIHALVPLVSSLDPGDEQMVNSVIAQKASKLSRDDVAWDVNENKLTFANDMSFVKFGAWKEKIQSQKNFTLNMLKRWCEYGGQYRWAPETNSGIVNAMDDFRQFKLARCGRAMIDSWVSCVKKFCRPLFNEKSVPLVPSIEHHGGNLQQHHRDNFDEIGVFDGERELKRPSPPEVATKTATRGFKEEILELLGFESPTSMIEVREGRRITREIIDWFCANKHKIDSMVKTKYSPITEKKFLCYFISFLSERITSIYYQFKIVSVGGDERARVRVGRSCAFRRYCVLDIQ